MSIRRRSLEPIPPAIASWAKKNPRNRIVVFADAIRNLFDWDDFTEMFGTVGQHGVPPARLAVLTILQHAEGLSDRQAIEAMNSRLDWKYALHLDLDAAIFDHTVLVEFRQKLVESGLQDFLLNKLLAAAEQNGLLKKSKQRTDSTHVLANVRTLGRLERIHEAVRAAIDELLTKEPAGYMSFHDQGWIDRYDRSPYNLKAPAEGKRRDTYVVQLLEDATALIEAVTKASIEYPKLSEVSSIAILNEILEQQCVIRDGRLQLRNDEESLPASKRIASPHDTDARFGRKGAVQWLGYTTHYTETCEADAPRLITNTLTAPAGTQDTSALPVIHRSLKGRGMAPEEHYVDAGYTDVEVMRLSEENLGITVVGPARPGPSWQAKEGKGFDAASFEIDFANKLARCPQGVTSKEWKQRHGGKEIQILFSKEDCSKCPFRKDCTKSTKSGRNLVVKSAELLEFLQRTRAREQTEKYKDDYKIRSGVEGTHSQAVRTCNFRRSPYRGFAKVDLKAHLVAAGLTAMRIANWLIGIPLTETRKNLRQKLAAAAA